MKLTLTFIFSLFFAATLLANCGMKLTNNGACQQKNCSMQTQKCSMQGCDKKQNCQDSCKMNQASCPMAKQEVKDSKIGCGCKMASCQIQYCGQKTSN